MADRHRAGEDSTRGGGRGRPRQGYTHVIHIPSHKFFQKIKGDLASLILGGDSMLIPYWPDRKVEITWWRVKRRNNKVTMMITPLYMDKELGKHCKGDWFYQKWWFIDLPF